MSNQLTNSNNLPSTQPVQVNQSVFNFTDMNSNITENTFPNKDNLIEILKEDQINRILKMIKNKILIASIENNTSIRVLLIDTNMFKISNVTFVKTFLVNKGYVITEIEGVAGEQIGWKLSW